MSSTSTSATDSSEPRRPGRPRRAGVDDAVLQATAELLSEVSFSRLSMEMVAQRAGVGKPTVYRRWPSKANLVLDVIVSFAPAVDTPTGEPASGEASFKERLRTTTFEVYRRLVSSAILHAMPGLAAELIHDRELGREFRERYVAPRTMAMMELLREGVDRGLLRADLDPWLMYKLLSGPSFYTLFMEGAAMTPAEIDQVFDEIWAVISTGSQG